MGQQGRTYRRPACPEVHAKGSPRKVQGPCRSRSEHGMGLAAAGYGLVAPSITPSFPSHWLLAMQVLTAEEGFNLTSCCSWLHLPVVPAKQTPSWAELGHHHILARLSTLHSFSSKASTRPLLFLQPLQPRLPVATFQHPYCQSIYIARRPHLLYAKRSSTVKATERSLRLVRYSSKPEG